MEQIGPSLVLLLVMLWMVLAGVGKKRLEWRPRPIKLRTRRRKS